MQYATNDPNDDDHAGVIELTADERAWIAARNVESIEAVPAAVWDALPLGAEVSREWALRRARRGHDVYAYCSGGERASGIYGG